MFKDGGLGAIEGDEKWLRERLTTWLHKFCEVNWNSAGCRVVGYPPSFD